MLNAVDQFKARVLKLELGEEYVYYTGLLTSARVHMPKLNEMASLANGLSMIGAVTLTQKRLGDMNFQYRLRVLRPIRNVDFDKGRAAFTKSFAKE